MIRDKLWPYNHNSFFIHLVFQEKKKKSNKNKRKKKREETLVFDHAEIGVRDEESLIYDIAKT